MDNSEICASRKVEPKENVVTFDSLAPEIQDILKKAAEVRENAYCPYSNFKVGASVLCEDGSVYSGCNVENVSFTVGICAERAAYSKAISDGRKKFQAVGVVALQEEGFTTPCGACRQFLREFGNVKVFCAKPTLDKVLTMAVDELLPLAFVSLP